jgi:surface antigen
VTDSEYPDPFRGLFDELGADSRADLAASSGVPENAPSSRNESVESNGWSLDSGDPQTDAAVPFTSRRAMREAGGYSAEHAEPATRPVARSAARTSSATRTKRAPKRTRTRDAVRAEYVKPAPKTWRRKLSSAGVMAVVIGLFATVTIPAFAEQDNLAQNAEPLDAQTLEVTASTTDESSAIRDTYGTTSASDLRKLYADAIRQQNLQAYLNSGAREMGDDYPWPDALSRPQGGGLSPLNYYYRECVDFVAWRMNRDAGTTSAPFRWVWSNLAQGSAYAWKREWERHGWPTGTTPQVGAVAWQPGGNHVAYVSGILADGSVVLEEYNYSVDHGYGQRIIQPGSMYYLYAPPA